MLNIPKDHKSIIYLFLDIKSLILLGSICKTFYTDEIRIRTLTQKVVDTYFYCKSSYTGIIRNWTNFPYEKLFYEIYIDKLKKISYDLRNIEESKDTHSMEKKDQELSNTNVVFERDVIIYIFFDAILRLPTYERRQIYQSLFGYINRLFSIGEKNRKNMRKLETHLYNDLFDLFRYEKNREMKKMIISEIDKLTKTTRAGEYIPTLKTFLYKNYEDVMDIIEIGEILLSLNKIEELKDIFRDFIFDMRTDVSTDHIKDTYYQLKMGCGGTTYEKKFYEMIKNVDSESFEDFERCMKQIEDIVRSDE